MAGPLTVYMTVGAILSDLREPDARNRAVHLMQRAGFGRIVLESYRGGRVAPEAVLRELRDYFQANGFDTLGGLMPVQGGNFGKRGEGIETRGGFFCYSSEDTVASLENEIRKLARLFDQVVIDDAFLTSCRCAECESGRQGRPWGVIRRELLDAVAARWVRAAHQENPSARLTFKFPQYYDRYPEFGYDAPGLCAIADAIWQGSETRNPDTIEYGYTEPYQGYFNVRWMARLADQAAPASPQTAPASPQTACSGGKFEAAWFDSLDCGDQEFFDQAVATFLAAPRDVTVFSYSEALLSHRMMARLAEALPNLERLRACAVEPWGVSVVKPPNANGGRDLFIFDYLGMLGIPCVPATELLPTMRSAIVPSHGIEDPGVVAAIPKALMSGRTVIVTFGALARMAMRCPELLEFFGYKSDGIAPGRTAVEAFDLNGEHVRLVRPAHVAGDLAPTDAAVLAAGLCSACEVGSLRIPFVTARAYASGGRAIVWNLETFGDDAFEICERLNVPVKSDLLQLPKPVADFLRQCATGPLGITITAPARVACFLFARHAAFVNYTPAPAEVALDGLRLRAKTLESDSPNTSCTANALHLVPRSHALVELAG